jgi:UDPglucose--hexose-1-phosphate uridylyltransferase
MPTLHICMNQPEAELRTDWLTGRSVFVAENRALRPNDFANEIPTGDPAPAGGQCTHKSKPSCPFCAGNESRTPLATYEKRDAHGRWQVRVVPNMYPAVSAGVPPAGPDVKASQTDFQQAAPAVGAHEVILEHPNHVDRMSVLSIDELRTVLGAYAERLRHWRDHGRFRYGLVFKNQGPRAGASISHLHSQLIALPFVPSEVEAEQRRAAEVHEEQRACPYCRLVAQERSAAKRVVDRDGFLAFCPFASWQPYEIWLMPVDHQPSFESAPASEFDRLAGVLHVLIERLESLVPNAAYNMLLRTSAWIAGCDDWSHWRLELLPRINSFAGLEVATGIHINPLSPERAAEQLRHD